MVFDPNSVAVALIKQDAAKRQPLARAKPKTAQPSTQQGLAQQSSLREL